MKNDVRILVIVMFMLAGTAINGQRKPDESKIKALKVAFLTERLSLSTGEAEIFWPLYNRYEDEKKALREKEWSEIHDKIKSTSNFSEKEANALLVRYLAIEEEQEELDKAFYKKLAGAISAQKSLLLFGAEHDFRKQLIRQYRSKLSPRE